MMKLPLFAEEETLDERQKLEENLGNDHFLEKKRQKARERQKLENDLGNDHCF